MSLKFKFLIIPFVLALTACSNSNNRGISHGKMINGKKEGTWKIYDSTGVLKEISNYKNDTLNGLRIVYYDNGRIYTKAHYKMGVFVDSFFLYFKNGQVRVESWFDSTGQEQGLCKIYQENGKLGQIGHVINNQYDDTIKTFYDNGQLMYLEYYKNGKKEGVFTTFDKQGNSIKQEYFKNDSLIKEKFLNSR